jgi:hypothetical protein
MMSDLDSLRLYIQEIERQRDAEKRGREEAEHQRDVERHRRKEAEKKAEISILQSLLQYLEACHALDTSIKVITDRSSTTKGDTTKPYGRIFPRRIVPWPEFGLKQQEIWTKLFNSPKFFEQKVFPSQHQVDYIKDNLQSISSEVGLRYFERDVVENAVRKLVNATYNDPVLREALGLKGTVTFESHTNLGEDSEVASESVERMPTDRNDGRNDNAVPPAPTLTSNAQSWKLRRRIKGMGGNADQFCIYKTLDGRKIPTVAIEYKAPHKLSVAEMECGLQSEIQPERDVINKDGQDAGFNAKTLAAAVFTQLFSYMVNKGIRHGYICTGQAFCFLYIPDDPATAYYALCTPKRDVTGDDEDRLCFTAVAQV